MATITSSQAQVRPMTCEDLVQVLSWRNHEDVRRYMYARHEITLAEHTYWYERAAQDKSRHLLIFESNAVPAGFISISQPHRDGSGMWGFYVAPDMPLGSGRLLGQAALSYAFSHLKLSKVCGEVLAYNKRSIRFHQDLGFQQESIKYKEYFDGQYYHDVLCFGLLASEWENYNCRGE